MRDHYSAAHRLRELCDREGWFTLLRHGVSSTAVHLRGTSEHVELIDGSLAFFPRQSAGPTSTIYMIASHFRDVVTLTTPFEVTLDLSSYHNL